MQARSGHTSKAAYRKEVSQNSPRSLFWDCPTTLKDNANAKAIFGPSFPCVRGKSVRSRPKMVEPAYISIPKKLSRDISS